MAYAHRQRIEIEWGGGEIREHGHIQFGKICVLPDNQDLSGRNQDLHRLMERI